MAKLYSNELKALVVPEDILSMKNVRQEQCHTVQQFNYNCLRMRNNRGEIYGPAEPVELEFGIRLNNPSDVKSYYKCLVDNDHFCFSFVFNATFDDNSYLKDYEDGMVCDGYVVSVAEDFSTSKGNKANDEQMLLTVKVLLINTTYLGRERNYQSTFIYQN